MLLSEPQQEPPTPNTPPTPPANPGTCGLQNMVTNIYGTSPYGDGTGSRPYGFIMGGDASVLAANSVYILVIIGWVLGIMTPFFIIIKKLGLMRVAPGALLSPPSPSACFARPPTHLPLWYSVPLGVLPYPPLYCTDWHLAIPPPVPHNALPYLPLLPPLPPRGE
jgi:hypothetical protein